MTEETRSIEIAQTGAERANKIKTRLLGALCISRVVPPLLFIQVPELQFTSAR